MMNERASVLQDLCLWYHTIVIDLHDKEKKEKIRGGKRFEVTIKLMGQIDLNQLRNLYMADR